MNHDILQFLEKGIIALMRPSTWRARYLTRLDLSVSFFRHNVFMTQCRLNILSDLMAKTIRVDEETYKRLVERAGKLQALLRRSVSLDETIRYLTEGLREQNKISDFSGSWKVSEEELEKIRKGLSEGWEKWH